MPSNCLILSVLTWDEEAGLPFFYPINGQFALEVEDLSSRPP